MLLFRPRSTRFLNCCLLSVFALALAAAAALPSPKNVIVLIGDGMGAAHVTAGRYFNGGPLSFEGLPYQGWSRTADLNGSVLLFRRRP